MIYTHVAAALLAGALAFAGAWKTQDWRYTWQIATMRAAQAEAQAAAITGARAQEQARFQGVQDAQVKATKRAQVARADSAAAHTELSRLRDAIRSGSGGVPGESAGACAVRADTVSQLQLECSAALVGLGEQADRLNADRLMLLEAWPK